MRVALLRLRVGRRRPRPTPPAPRASRRRRARSAVLLLPAALLAVLTAAWGGVETVRPETVDPDYFVRRDVLRARIAENPGRPVALVIGSSRLIDGFAPDTLPDPAGGPVLWFNASQFGSGPVFQNVILSRLLADDVRPAVVVFEVMPPFFSSEKYAFLAQYLRHHDLARVHRFTPPGELDLYYLRDRLTRPARLGRVADPFAGVVTPRPYGGNPTPIFDVTAADRAARVAAQRGSYDAAAKNLTVRPAADRALRAALAACREHGITPVLLLSPEGPTFRSWYDAAALARFEGYVGEVAREHGVRLIDARDWLPEADFMDSHHPLYRGSVAFTARLVAELNPASRAP
ncbi:MAG TPA: hypothetical protein VD866_02870 [Urbifossiella sp.]|nr:hypothetical protein [Urbifossiella sp.]